MATFDGTSPYEFGSPTPRPADRRLAFVTPPAMPCHRSAYRASGWANGPAGVAAVAVAVGLVAALAFLNVDVHPATKPRELTVMSVALTPPPPPPPSAPAHSTRAKPAEERIEAPAPLVAVPRVAPIAVAPQPPAPPLVAVTAPAPVATEAAPGPPNPPAIADGGDMSSRMIEARPPTYPIDSRRRREQGTVVLDVLVAATGKVSAVTVAQSSGSGLLDHAALAAVRGWRWAPTIRDDRPVMVHGTVRIPFVLTG